MRSRRSLALLSWALIVLLATAGFAAFSTSRSRPADPVETSVAAARPIVIASPSARVAAFLLADSITYRVEVPERFQPPNPMVRLGPDGSSTTSTSTTTTTAAPATTTTHTHAPTTTQATTTTHTHAPTTTSSTTPSGGGGGHGNVEGWRPLVAQYFPDHQVESALSVMRCESNGDPNAVNSRSGASGLFQFMPGTWNWASAQGGFGGYSPFHAEANIASAAWLVEYSTQTGHPRGPWGHWTCRP